MKIKSLILIVAMAVFCVIFVLLNDVQAQRNAVDQEVAGVNLAVVAEALSSYTSGDTTLAALNDGNDPRNSRDRRRGSYGNWNRRGTQWVQYDWSQAISTKMIEVYWWGDGQGVHPPAACRLYSWDGSGFVEVKNASGLGVEIDKFNRTTFEEVTTSRLRLEIDSDGTNSTGILEWKVFDSGKSPDFPPTVVADVDRVVMVGGKTYLNGVVKTLIARGAEPKVRWSKDSGSGTVRFANAEAVETTATFSAAGDYVLKLTANKGELSDAATLKVKVEEPPAVRHLDLIDTKGYKIDSPFWNDRVKALIVNWIPHCIEKISDPDVREGGINNFIDAAKALAGEEHGNHRGYVFSNAWVYNTIESMSVALMIDAGGDREILAAQENMRETLADWIPTILAAQEPDGYIQTAYTLRDPARWTGRWTARARANHEGYVAGYFLEAAIAHYLMTDKHDSRLYVAAKKLADCWYDNLGPTPKQAWYDGHQEMEIALVRFGRFVNKIEGAGKGDKYIELSKFLLDNRMGGSEYDQSHVSVVQQYEAVGHAVRAVYSYAGMADVAMETGNIDYQSAVMSLWDNIVNKKYYVTGGVGSGETSEGFGPDYSLRNNAYCESCSSCGEIFFQHKLNLTYHDSKYADLYEETLYNALLGSMDLEGKNFYYQNPLDTRSGRYDWHGCPCCVGNIPRTLLMLPTWMYLKGDDGIYVNLFIGSTVTLEDVAGVDVEMVQKTDYPWSGDVSITVNPATEKRFAVKVRVPNRQVSELYKSTPQANGITSIAVNGEIVRPSIENGYAVITRRWKAGDKIELVMPMTVQRIKADEQIEATRGKMALRYGPLIYNVEQVDQDISQVFNPESELTTEWRGDLLGGVMVIKGKWVDGSELLAIPNYVRSNRLAAETAGAVVRGRGSRQVSSIVWIKDR